MAGKFFDFKKETTYYNYERTYEISVEIFFILGQEPVQQLKVTF